MKHFLVLSALIAVSLARGTSIFEPSNYPASPSNITDPTVRIVGGANAARNQFPYQVSVQRRSGTSFSHICGGSIVSPNWILSAAHCTPLTAPNYRIVAGILLLNDQNIAGQQAIAVQRVINHPGYPGNNVVAPDDVCLLHLAARLNYGVNVQPIPIPQAGTVSTGNAVLSGWGLTRPGGTIPNHLQFLNKPIVPAAECNRILSTLLGLGRNPFNVNLNICSGVRTGGESACSGDSGGPLVHNGRVIGIVNWVLMPCGAHGAPSVYARTSAYVSWINQQTNGEVRP